MWRSGAPDRGYSNSRLSFVLFNHPCHRVELRGKFRMSVRSVLLLGSIVFFPTFVERAEAHSLSIVAIGASNTQGWGVGVSNAYPAQLEHMLRTKGYDAKVTNSGVPFETTSGMRRRVNSAVPDGTDLVILQPGGNDLRFFVTVQQRTENIEALVQALRYRKIPVIVYDPIIPSAHYQWDRIHLTFAGHRMFASQLLPQVISSIRKKRGLLRPGGNARAAESGRVVVLFSP